MNVGKKSSFRPSLFMALAACGVLALSAAFPGRDASGAGAAAVPTTPAAFFNYASIIGLNKSISVVRLPIQISDGSFIYKDVTIPFNVDGAGNLTYATLFPVAMSSPPLSNTVRAGTYGDTSSGNPPRLGIQVTGPAPPVGGVSQWSITAAPGLGCDPPQPATFYTGPQANSPLAARIKKAGITATQFFGTIGAIPCQNGNWYNNSLFGVSVVGNQLLISSFSSFPNDTSSPTTEITYNFLK